MSEKPKYNKVCATCIHRKECGQEVYAKVLVCPQYTKDEKSTDNK